MLSGKNLLSCALVISALPVSTSAVEKLLLLDDRVVERADRLVLRVGEVTKHPANPLFQEDRPWEVRFDNVYPNLTYDEAAGEYRCWYSPFIVDELTTGTPAPRRAEVKYHATPSREMGVAYASSKDGLHWTKPELGLVEFVGSAANNLVMRSVHGAGVLDDRHEKDPARRFKAFGGQQIPGQARRFEVAFSPDGLRWSEPIVAPEIGVDGDTHNNAIWVPERGKYVGITRRWLAGQRRVMRSESADFTRWSPVTEVMRGDDINQTYAMSIFPYGGVYLGLVAVMNQRTDRVQCELAWSPDTVHWRRIDPGRALIPNSEKLEAYDWGCVYAGTGPIVHGDEVRLYYGASNAAHSTWRDGFLALATLPLDRFAGYVAGADEGSLVTRIVTIGDGQLTVNLSAPNGRVSVEVLDAQQRPIDGYTASLDHVDALHAALSWEEGADLAALSGRQVRFRFRLQQATLFAVELR